MRSRSHTHAHPLAADVRVVFAFQNALMICFVLSLYNAPKPPPPPDKPYPQHNPQDSPPPAGQLAAPETPAETAAESDAGHRSPHTAASASTPTLPHRYSADSRDKEPASCSAGQSPLKHQLPGQAPSPKPAAHPPLPPRTSPTECGAEQASLGSPSAEHLPPAHRRGPSNAGRTAASGQRSQQRSELCIRL